MRASSVVLAILAAVSWAAPSAAEDLTILEVNAPAVNCVFRASCTIVVTDSIGHIPMPQLDAPNTAWLQSRTFTAEAGAPAAGKTGYLYRVSLTEAAGTGECLLGLVLNFGPVAKLPYKPGQMADVFVITTGGLGTIGIKSATKTGDVIEFAFATPLCLEAAPNIKDTTFFFGLAAATAPMATKAHIWAPGDPAFYEIDARVPTH
ncbi:MAG TPA: hypothetical protein VF601_08570 [Beijerinckiaceae bacterium]|jgi:hypothetical protein